MKKTTFYLLTVLVFILNACVSDDNHDEDPKYFGPSIKEKVSYLKGIDAQRAINLLNYNLEKEDNKGLSSNSSTMRTGNWDVEFDEILLVTDDKGNNNYTYRVKHPNETEDVFYNLILTENSTRTTIKLVRYAMSERFAYDYNNKGASITSFAGTITFTPILDDVKEFFPIEHSEEPQEPTDPSAPQDPCEDETVIEVPDPPTNPGGGGPVPPITSGGDSGGGSGGSSNAPKTLYNGTQTGCFEWVEVKCNGGGEHVGDDDTCTGSFKGATYLVNNCTGQSYQVLRNGEAGVIADPCAPIGDIGVLEPNLGLKIARKIEDEIVDEDLDECSKQVLLNLKTLTQSDIANIILKFDPSPSLYKVTIKTEQFEDNDFAQTFKTNPTIRYQYTIRMKSSYVATATKLSIARTMIHEIIHAYLLSLVDDQATGVDPNSLDDFPLLFENYVRKTYGPGATAAQHETMARHYVDIIARALQEYNTGIPVAEGHEPEEIYNDLAWGGLRETTTYNNLFPQGSTIETRIYKKLVAEDYGIQYGEYSPVSTRCD